jgi:hypothetical protein
LRAIVYNDTSRFHHGCCSVMRTLHREAERAGIEILESVYGNTWRLSRSYPIWRAESLGDADLVIVNGEGTMHDDSRMAVFYLDEVIAKRGHRKVALVNSLWQRMAPRHAALLAEADLVSVREPLSHAALGLASAAIMPDLSYYDVPVPSRLPPQGHIRGTFYGPAFRALELDGSIDVRREDWGVMVNRLRHAGACLTGKHHEVMACCVARCPFVSIPVATHKISGLGAYAGGELPTVPPDAGEAAVRAALARAEADRDGAFARLFDRLETVRAGLRLGDLLTRLA